MVNACMGTMAKRGALPLKLPAWNSGQPLQRPFHSGLRGARFCSTTVADPTPKAAPIEKLSKPPAPPSLPPHSLLPGKMLLRSLLVATISSHKILLGPSLALLSFLSKPHGALFSVEKNPFLYWLLKKTLYTHFCAGENKREVTATIRWIKEMGFKGVILTYAREVVVDETSKQEEVGVGAHEISKGDVVVPEAGIFDEGIEAWRQGVLETVGMIGEGDFLALKYVSSLFLLLVVHPRMIPLRILTPS